MFLTLWEGWGQNMTWIDGQRFWTNVALLWLKWTKCADKRVKVYIKCLSVFWTYYCREEGRCAYCSELAILKHANKVWCPIFGSKLPLVRNKRSNIELDSSHTRHSISLGIKEFMDHPNFPKVPMFTFDCPYLFSFDLMCCSLVFVSSR